MRRRTRSACEIGSEGDSLAGEDECGLTRVGSKRVGAYTRAARDGKYRARATLTDSGVVLRCLDPDSFSAARCVSIPTQRTPQ